MSKKTIAELRYSPRAGFASFVGNEAASQYLHTVLQTDHFHQAYIFSGPEHVGKTTLAILFARQILERKVGKHTVSLPFATSGSSLTSHPDYIFFSGNEFSGIDQTRELIRQTQQSPVRAPYRVVVITDLDALSESSMNALLKTFEESSSTIFLCTTARAGALLPTIRSRCQHLRLDAVPLARLKAAAENVFMDLPNHVLLQMSGGLPGLLVTWMQDAERMNAWQQQYEAIRALRKQSQFERYRFAQSLLKDKKDFRERQEQIRNFLRQLLSEERVRLLANRKHASSPELRSTISFIKKILQMQKKLEQNVHPGLILQDVLFSYA